MIQLTKEEKKSHRKQTFCYICKIKFSYNDKKCYEVKDQRSAAHNIISLI